jgi:hypothetical protein
MTIGRTELPPHTRLVPATVAVVVEEGSRVGGTALPARTEFSVDRREIVFSVLPPKSKEVVRRG